MHLVRASARAKMRIAVRFSVLNGRPVAETAKETAQDSRRL